MDEILWIDPTNSHYFERTASALNHCLDTEDDSSDRRKSTNRSLLAHRYWVLVHMGRHRVAPPVWTVRKWSGHSQVCPCPPWRIRHRCEQPPLLATQGLFTVRGRVTGVSNGVSHNAALWPHCSELRSNTSTPRLEKVSISLSWGSTHWWAACKDGTRGCQTACVWCWPGAGDRSRRTCCLSPPSACSSRSSTRCPRTASRQTGEAAFRHTRCVGGCPPGPRIWNNKQKDQTMRRGYRIANTAAMQQFVFPEATRSTAAKIQNGPKSIFFHSMQYKNKL